MRTTNKIFTLSLMTLALAACGGGDPGDKLTKKAAVTSSTAVFNPALGGDGLPFPIDLLFASTADGSINIPGKPSSFDPADAAGTFAAATSTPAAAFLADPQTALNTMDGFSTTAPMVVRFSDPVTSPTDQTLDGVPDGIRVFETTLVDPGANYPVTIDHELVYGVDYVAGVTGGTTLLIIPLKPLKPSTTHIVSVDTNLKTTGGASVSADSTYSLLSGAYLLTAGIGAVSGMSDFIVQNTDGASCDFTSLASVSVCTDVNTEDYQLVVDNVPPAAAGATAVVTALTGLEAQAMAAADYSTLWQLEQLRRITAKHLGAIEGEGVDPAEVVLTYSVSTEDVGSALASAQGQVQSAGTTPSISVLNPVVAWDTGVDAFPYEVTSPGADGDITTTDDYFAHIYLGTLNDMIQFMDPADQNNSVWEGNTANWISAGPCTALAANPAGTKNLVGCNGYIPDPKVTDHSVPVLISAPRIESINPGLDPSDLYPDCDSSTYPSGLPVVIYQHGITTSRATLLAIADTLARACVVGVAIDMPKHGILPTNDPFGASQLAQLEQALQQPPFFSAANPAPVMERMVQVASPATQCQAQLGVATLPDNGDFYCPSGDNYVNLSNLANARDSLRQSVVDLYTLYEALSNNTITADSGNDIDTGSDTGLDASTIGTAINTGNIHFVGVSLGSIVGAPFVATESSLSTALLNVGGGGIAKILDGSPSFEPSITAGLYAAGGISKPGGDYEGFLIIAQTMVDNTDAMNFATDIAATGTPILMQEVVGDLSQTVACLTDGSPCPDQVVPNNVFGNSFGDAWGLISQSGQDNYLPNQNFVTTPVALAGTDALAQGTGFVYLGGAVAANPLAAPAAIGLGPIGVDGGTFPATAITFKGIGLQSIGPCGADNGGIVRFVSGDHGSLLSPASDALVTTEMQKQMATFIASSGTVVPADLSGVVANRPSASQDSDVACP